MKRIVLSLIFIFFISSLIFTHEFIKDDPIIDSAFFKKSSVKEFYQIIKAIQISYFMGQNAGFPELRRHSADYSEIVKMIDGMDLVEGIAKLMKLKIPIRIGATKRLSDAFYALRYESEKSIQYFTNYIRLHNERFQTKYHPENIIQFIKSYKSMTSNDLENYITAVDGNQCGIIATYVLLHAMGYVNIPYSTWIPFIMSTGAVNRFATLSFGAIFKQYGLSMAAKNTWIQSKNDLPSRQIDAVLKELGCPDKKLIICGETGNHQNNHYYVMYKINENWYPAENLIETGNDLLFLIENDRPDIYKIIPNPIREKIRQTMKNLARTASVCREGKLRRGNTIDSSIHPNRVIFDVITFY